MLFGVELRLLFHVGLVKLWMVIGVVWGINPSSRVWLGPISNTQYHIDNDNPSKGQR